MILLRLLCLVVVSQTVMSNEETYKIGNLEKQLQILLNLVNTQSNIMTSFQSCNNKQMKNSESCSKYILMLANQTYRVENLQKEVKYLNTLIKNQQSQLQQLQSSVNGLVTKVADQEKNLGSIDSKYSSVVSSLRSEIANTKQKTSNLENKVNSLETKVQQFSGTWPTGKYCILASGSCPAGFTRSSGYMRAISLYSGAVNYINQAPVSFGDSKIQCHGRCGQYGHWTGELYITACCK